MYRSSVLLKPFANLPNETTNRSMEFLGSIKRISIFSIKYVACMVTRYLCADLTSPHLKPTPTLQFPSGRQADGQKERQTVTDYLQITFDGRAGGRR